MTSLLPPSAHLATSTDQEPASTLPVGGRRQSPSELLFTYTLEESVPPDRRRPYRHIERWMVTIAVEAAEPHSSPVTVGDARVIVVELEAGRDVRDFADVVTGEWREAEPAAPYRPATGGGRPGRDRPSTRSHVLVLERIWVKPDHRGNGLGPIIAAAVINRLGRGCRMAACFPAPFEGDRRDREREIEALGRLWAKVGFRPWGDGVWMMPLGEFEVPPVPVRGAGGVL